MNKPVSLIYSFEEKKEFLERNGFEVQSFDRRVFIAGSGMTDEEYKVWKVLKDGEDVCPWSCTAGSWDVDYVFDKELRRRILGL
jgi:maleate cis-trans isomerase